MAHLLFDALNGVTLDNQTALTVQSLLDSHGLSGDVTSNANLNATTPTTVTLDEEDVFQCGKCKKQFTSFSLFMCHKKEHTAASPGKMGGAGLPLSLERDLQCQDHGPQMQGSSTDSTNYQQLQVHTLHGGVTSPDLGQPIILGDNDILSFSIDQGSLNIASSAQTIPSLPNVIQSGTFLAPSADAINSPKPLAEDETSSTSSSFNVATLAGQPIILTSSELTQGSFLTSALPSIQSIAPQSKLSSLQTVPSTVNNSKDNARNINIMGSYPNRLMKGCKVLLPNIDYIDSSMEGNRTMLLDCEEESGKKTDNEKVLQYEESSLINNRTLLLNYSTGDTRKTCKVLLPGVEYTGPSIEYIDCGTPNQENIVGYQDISGSRQETVTVDLMDVVQPVDAQSVTLNLPKSGAVTRGEGSAIEIRSIPVASDGLSISVSETNNISECHKTVSDTRLEETADQHQASYQPKSLKVLLPGVQYTGPNIEYIDCGAPNQENIVEYQNMSDPREGATAVTVDLMDVVQPVDAQSVTLNLPKSSTVTRGDGNALEIRSVPLASVSESNTISNCQKTASDTKMDEVADRHSSYPLKSLKLKCDFCPKMFAKNFDLQQHLRSHTGEKPFQCVVCGRAFSQKSNVKKHLATHKVWPNGLSRTLPKQPLQIIRNNTAKSKGDSSSDQGSKESDCEKEKDTSVIIDRSYVCQYCNAAYTSYFELKTHMKEHSHQKVYKCIQRNCQKTFSDLDAFLEHTAEHSNEVQYCCHVCCKKFTSLADLSIHQYCHTPCTNKSGSKHSRFFLCMKCKSKFTSSKALEHHLSTTNHHFPCSHCGKVFACERYLRRHLPTHGAPESFTCPQCGKGFRTEQYLNTHRFIHTGEKPFSCQHCPAAFNRKDKLARHALIHQAVKKFKCPFHKYLGCSKAFNRQDKLKLHILTHSAVKRTQCKKCNKVFHQQNLLREHEKTCSCNTRCKKKLPLPAPTSNSPTDEQVSSQEGVDTPEVIVRKTERTTSGVKNQRKSRSHKQGNTEDVDCGKKKNTVTQADINVENSGAGDNVPTIEIIVMPVALDQREGSDQNMQDKGVYHVMFPASAPTIPPTNHPNLPKADCNNIHFPSKHTVGGKTIVTLLENSGTEVNSEDRNEEVVTADQEVPVATVEERLLKVMIPSNRA